MLRALIFVSLIVMVMAQCSVPNQNGLQCSTDCRSIGYCSNNQWYPIKNCKDTFLCDGTPPNLSCKSGDTCTTLQRPTEVQCTESTLGQNVPNIMDSSCSTYFTCNDIDKPADFKYCPIGESFNFCTRNCQSNAVCPTESPCATIVTVLSSNRSLAYACIRSDPSTVDIMIWWSCSIGAYDSKGACVSFDDYNCQNTGICAGVGNIPIPNTNCEYRKCYADGTYADIQCSPENHYDTKQGLCVPGACTQL